MSLILQNILPTLLSWIASIGDILKFLSDVGLLTIAGWVLVFWLGLKANKIHQRNAARLEVYKELYQLKLKIDKSSISFSLLLWEHAPPFMYMDWAEKGSPTAQGKKPYELWGEYIKQLTDANSEFSDDYQKFWNQVNMWITIMPELKESKNILFQELGTLSSDIWAHIGYLRDLQVKEYDWKKWNQEEIKRKAKEINERFSRVALGYLNDFMDCLHDELIAPIFDEKRVIREEFSYTKPTVSKILTKGGIKEIEFKPRTHKKS